MDTFFSTGQYQDDINDLNILSKYRYENIFKVYQDPNTYYYYNILKNINIPNDIDPEYYTLENVNFDIPLTNISYKFYNTIELWWLILIVNKISNLFLSGVHQIKIIKPKYIDEIINSIHKQL